MQRYHRFSPWPLGLLLIASMLAGCAARSDLPQLGPDEVAERAAAKMAAIKSLHFAIELTGRLTYIDPAGVLALKSAEGDIAAPDRVQAVVRTRTFGTSTELRVVGIGPTQWARNPANGRWETLPPELGSFDIGALFDAETGLAGLLRGATFATVEQTALDGQPHYLLSTETPGQQLAPMTSGMITEGVVAVRLYVDGATFALTQIELVERDTDPDEPTSWLIKLGAFDQPVTIAPPPTS